MSERAADCAKRDARVAAGRLDDQTTRLELTRFIRAANDVQRRSVLDAARMFRLSALA